MPKKEAATLLAAELEKDDDIRSQARDLQAVTGSIFCYIRGSKEVDQTCI